ncbi:hypothetical protein [Alkalihalobacillus trypoxylicola]|uniref:Uncharacterized protein n=1 Tax=Alkalihalobacillus trypoxylicola TaxID=519424 RepID=A0A161PFP9_9BACI|nr:hypothetical protein [Alkalihalobacillus trypoxylicola]KYG31977.1 hypothetical protein AZF04_04165 [Alkalihalobacillus trypoxylicola]
MNSLFIIIILATLFLSLLSTIIVMKKRRNKYVALSFSFIISLVILVTATPIVYNGDPNIFINQSNLFFANLGIYTLIYFIPLITLINFCVISLLVKKEQPSEPKNQDH